MRVCLFLALIAILTASDLIAQQRLEPEVSQIENDDLYLTEEQEIILQLMEERGLDPEKVTFEGVDVIYDGDMYFHKSVLLLEKELKDCSHSKQRRYANLVLNENVKDIRIQIDSTVSSAWVSAISDALQAYRDLPSCSINFYVVENSPDVVITEKWLGWMRYGYAYGPVNGMPGTNVFVGKYARLNHSERVFTVVHELGHIVGMAHTDDANHTLIRSTPESDENSVFNSAQGTWNGFSYWDVNALRWLYPDVEK
ncbi:M57 family metalloprotease [Acanthopleuribacter pedis]|uniref:Peptidase metallopeptidase domain-containing protein n=1 Tax=Acanthopleuribacter pedis TaxID=442870 RepID=A0A8J7U283_9BACT|nr:M57 family metalloprotease [Acanthopleuribacter pedis]MBO1318332.1 hypothetical protein [Acanthopleuribacter pedis]